MKFKTIQILFYFFHKKKKKKCSRVCLPLQLKKLETSHTTWVRIIEPKKERNWIDKNEIFMHTVEVDYGFDCLPHDENYGS